MIIKQEENMEEESFAVRFRKAWNAFRGRDPTVDFKMDYGLSSSYRPDVPKFTRGNERSIVTSVYNRIAMDCAAIDIEHVILDENGNYTETLSTGLNNCLTLDANIDQTGPALIQDVVMSMFDEGCIAVVPVDTSLDPDLTDGYDILTLRTGRITEWHPAHVKVNIYNERDGRHHDLMLPKKTIAIIQNPLFAIMNERNSTLQRLIRTLNTLDQLNRDTANNKLDLIIQLPYVVRNEVKKKQAESRRRDIEQQLSNGAKYGIAYTDGTERITQLNRPVENNLWAQATELQAQLYNQLGLTQSIFDGTADEKTMINYYNRTINPILSSITLEMTRKFITKNGRSRGQAIRYFRDPFKLMPVEQLAEIADKFTRNEIMTSNEIRSKVGLKPSKDPRADELRNKNLNPVKDPNQKQTDEIKNLDTSKNVAINKEENQNGET